MRKDKLFKIAALNIGIAAFDIIVFSEGIMNISLTGSGALETAFGATSIIMSILVFGAGNYRLLNQKEQARLTQEIKTAEDCISELERNYGKKTFNKDIDTISEQINRLVKKKDTINDILLQKFSPGELSYVKFQNAVLDGENLFYENIRSILNKINAFDEEDYNRIKRGSTQMNFSESFIKSKMDIYNEYISFVKDSIEDNEQILLKYDMVLLEISKLNCLQDGELEKTSAMKEIDDLINNIKWYK